MNAKQYNNVINHTLKQYQSVQQDDILATARAIFKNAGVALPNGDLATVSETLATNNYMGWRSCTMQEAQEAANNGKAAIGVGADRIVVLSANSKEEPVAQTASVMTLDENTSAYAVDGLRYYVYGGGATGTTTEPWYRILTCYQTENDCYKAGRDIGTIKGIVVHSTGVNNPWLKRYVDYPEEVGVNTNGNHWNQEGKEKMVHAFIGLDKNEAVTIVNTLPYTYACWGVGSGTNGSYNYAPNGHIQFEICEDAKTDSAYFNNAVFGAAVEYCVYLCHHFSLSVDSIVSHKEAHDQGYASNHGDPEHWMVNFNKTMDDFRDAVRTKLSSYETETSTITN